MSHYRPPSRAEREREERERERAREREESKHDSLADTYTDLKLMVESDDNVPDMSRIIRGQVRFAEIATEQISTLKTRCANAEARATAADKRTAVLAERIKWVWWVVGSLIALIVWCIKTAIEYRLAHP